MRTSHRAKRPTPKTEEQRKQMKQRKLDKKGLYAMPEGVSQCEYCHRRAGRNMEAGETGELRQTLQMKHWICSRHPGFYALNKVV